MGRGVKLPFWRPGGGIGWVEAWVALLWGSWVEVGCIFRCHLLGCGVSENLYWDLAHHLIDTSAFTLGLSILTN